MIIKHLSENKKIIECENCKQQTLVLKKTAERFKTKFKYCGSCRKFQKKCTVCKNEHFNQGKTCSPKCAQSLKEKTYLKSCGAIHNFSKESKSRKEWELKMFENEGIENVFQRSQVKEKSLDSLKKHFNLNYDIKNVSQIPEIKNKVRETFETTGLWIPKKDWPKRKIYYHNVWEYTWANLKKYAQLEISNDFWVKLKESRKLTRNEWICIDHIYAINQGFLNNIDPKYIGHIKNLQPLTMTENRKKWERCDITIEKLIELYNIFEKKINYEN